MTDARDDRVSELEARAAARRRDGTYPPDLDAVLEADVEDRLRSVSTHTSALRAAVAQLRDLGAFEMPAYQGTNRLKAWYAKVVGKAIGHVSGDLVRQLEAHRLAVERVVDAIVEEIEPADTDRRG